ncbi:TonB-dependent receptor [Caulobacter segnis]|uniref:TonB-dependent receptor n=2 Tax=Caulobacter segnis TaxID=88688 RepID=D5VL33_CAUST|nr:TonB-dependent receptor [Caulobacter segnis]ADG11206.1 TonB-dependent receptor [Caulobacter segnis ATCC 21756]AVQ02887.1 TonB-dependent receptor [Caulobacter segnis]
MTFMTRRAALLAATGLVAFSANAFAQTTTSSPAPAKKEPSNQVQGVTITAPNGQDIKTSIDRRSYSLGKDIQATTGSVADVLRNVPSVQVDVQGNVSLRGDSNVTIMIDGKPSGMFKGENRGQVLQQIPASQFERVEVMTNPSAAFSPEGTAGVINLITKQQRAVGTTGSVRGNFGTEGRKNASISLARNTKALTLSADAGWRRDKAKGRIVDERERLDTATGQYSPSHQKVDFVSRGQSHNARAGVDYDLDKKTRLSAEARYNDMTYKSKSGSDYDGRTPSGAPSVRYQRRGDGEMKRSVAGLSSDLRRKLSGDDHEFTVRASLERTRDRQTTASDGFNQLPVASNYAERVRIGDELVQTRLKAEYKRPLPDGAKLVAGYELQIDDNDYDNFGARGPIGGSLTTDPALTNQFKYDQAVNAFYATYSRAIGDWTVMPGLRLEEVQVDTNQVTSSLKDSYDYLRAYPSLHVQYKVDDTRQINASYSRRIQRPTAQDLNPYRIYQDPYNYRQGDPRLKPQVTDSFEVAYQLRKGFNYYLGTLYWRQARDGVTDVVRELPGGALLTTKANLAKSRSGGLELVANARLTPKISYTISGNAAWNEIGATDLGFPDSRSTWAVSGYAALNIQATPKDFLQISGFAIGKRLTPQGYREPTGMLNLGYRHKFNDRLSGVITVQDSLKTFGDKLVINTAALKERRAMDLDLRAIFVGVTYGFGGQGAANPRRPREPAFDFQTTPGGVGPM